MQLAPHQSDHSLLDEDDHVHAQPRPQEAEERLNALPPSHAPRLSDRNYFFFPFRLCFDPETFVRPFSNKVLGVKTQSEWRMEGKAAQGRSAHHSLTIWSPWPPAPRPRLPSVKIVAVQLSRWALVKISHIRLREHPLVPPFIHSPLALHPNWAGWACRSCDGGRQSLPQAFNTHTETRRKLCTVNLDGHLAKFSYIVIVDPCNVNTCITFQIYKDFPFDLLRALFHVSFLLYCISKVTCKEVSAAWVWVLSRV